MWGNSTGKNVKIMYDLSVELLPESNRGRGRGGGSWEGKGAEEKGSRGDVARDD